MPSITLLVAPPGAGKTTLAKSLIENDGDLGAKTVYINQDSQGKEDHLKLFDSAISESKDVIVDRLNFVKGQRNRYLDPAKSKGYKTKIIVLHVPYEECMERCLARKNHETIKTQEDASKALSMFFQKYERVEDNEADVVERRGWDRVYKPDAIYVDIDNTLADNSHREHHLKGIKPNWKAFFSEMDKDIINHWCRRICNSFFYDKTPTQVLIVSARPDDYRQVTKDWLSTNEVMYDHLLMRQRNDFRKDSIVKLQIYEFEIKPRYNLLFSVDDRKQVIDEMRKHGVVVLDCAGEKGNF